jgi:aspartyl-tRNA(Asn)/glutamyl-tRNA(Gln) amidotransferase subunit A
VPQWPLGAFGNVAVAGPITRTVRDAALMLNVLASFDPRDPFCLPSENADYRTGIEDGVKGLRIGILRSPGFAAQADADAWDALEITRKILEDSGATVIDADIALPDSSEIFSKIWGAALARLVAMVPAEKHHLLDAGLTAVAAQFANVTASDMIEAEALRLTASHAMAQLHTSYDAVICPCVPSCAPRAGQKLTDPVHALWHDWAPWTFLFNLTRQPAISIPIGVNANNLPRAVQIATALYNDSLLLRIARTVERAM